MDLAIAAIPSGMRQRVDVVQLKETGPKGYTFTVHGADYALRFEDGAWRLVAATGESDLFESFNEAMNHVLEHCPSASDVSLGSWTWPMLSSA